MMVLAAVIAVGVVKMYNASQVFERIIGQLDETRTDEVGRLRREREVQSESLSRELPPPGPRTSSGQQ